MATKRRKRKTKTAQTLKGLICVLSLVLVVLLGVVFFTGGEEEDPALSGSDATQSTPSAGTTDPIPTGTIEPPLTGWVTLDGKTYYYGDDSVMRTGAAQIEGMVYCFDSEGVLSTGGWLEIGENTYYTNDDGTAFIGWLEDGDELRYFRADGTMARGAEEIDGQMWYFTSTGCQIYIVNPWNYLPEDYDPELVPIGSKYAADTSKVEAGCYDALIQMLDDCTKAGHNVYIVSGYRTMATQTTLFERQVDKQIAAFGYTREEAEKVAATISAIPGTSEHQLGLAVDIIDTRIWDLVEEQEDLAGQQWLMAHCWEYGFILRYPKDKTDVTGIIYEPWHYRYVGTELAAELHGLGLTLEEYIAGLS